MTNKQRAELSVCELPSMSPETTRHALVIRGLNVDTLSSTWAYACMIYTISYFLSGSIWFCYRPWRHCGMTSSWVGVIRLKFVRGTDNWTWYRSLPKQGFMYVVIFHQLLPYAMTNQSPMSRSLNIILNNNSLLTYLWLSATSRALHTSSTIQHTHVYNVMLIGFQGIFIIHWCVTSY